MKPETMSATTWGHRVKHDPTPEEIAAVCALIRQDWSEEVHRCRAGMERVAGWMPPGIDRYLGAAEETSL